MRSATGNRVRSFIKNARANGSTYLLEAGGFNAVARERGGSQPTISRMIAALERLLGERLLNRSSSGPTLTDDGHAFEAKARRVLAAVAEAEESVGDRRDRPTGLPRLGCSDMFATTFVMPRIAEFLERYPDVEIDLDVKNAYVDPVIDRLDLVVCVVTISDATLVARHIGRMQPIVVASKEYLARHGTPSMPSDLASHQCLANLPVYAAKQWRFQCPEGPIVVDVHGPVCASSAQVLRAAVMAGVGMTMVLDGYYEDALHSGQVREVLRDFRSEALPVHALYSSRRYLSAKVRAMIDFLATTPFPEESTPI